MKAYIQTQSNGDWLNENCYTSAQGFSRMGYDVIKFTTSDVANNIHLQIKSDDVVHGGILAIRNLIDKLGYAEPEIHNPHTHLLKYTHRTFEERKLKDIIEEYANGYESPIFIKPLTQHKLFTGFVVNSFSDLIKMASYDGNVDILTSSVSNFISEYRCFVDRQKLVGCKNYTGDFTVFPNFKTINDAITDYKGHPIAYSLDFGITDTGDTQLIEINDGFGLGSYGLNPIIYCKMIRDRWNEIIQNKI